MSEIELDRFTPEQLRLLRAELLPPETSDGEFELFVEQCYRTRLDPFARQIQGTPGYSKGKFKLTVVVTIDGFRAIADRSGHYDGQTEQEWCGPDGQWRTVWLETDPPAAARCGVYKRGSTHPVYAVITWDESPGPGSRSPLWKAGGMRAHMLSKCAEALALRKAFPNQLGGLYTTDELPHDQGAPTGGPVASGGGSVAPPVSPPEDPPALSTVPPEMVDGETRSRLVTSLTSAKSFLSDAQHAALRVELVERGVLADTGHVVDPLPVGAHRAGLAAIDGFDGGGGFTPEEVAGTAQPEAYRKADLMVYRDEWYPDLDDTEFMELVLERARELTPTAKPADVIRSWRALQSRPALVQAIIGMVEARRLEGPLPEPFEVGAE